jgi:hypothetical protein
MHKLPSTYDTPHQHTDEDRLHLPKHLPPLSNQPTELPCTDETKQNNNLSEQMVALTPTYHHRTVELCASRPSAAQELSNPSLI